MATLTSSSTPDSLSVSFAAGDTKRSRTKGLAALLKEVYQFHVETVAELEARNEELQKKCAKLDRAKTELFSKGQDLKNRNELLLSDLRTANSKLQVPCEVCQVLRSQIEQQEKLYKMVVGAMKRGKNRGTLSSDPNRDPLSQFTLDPDTCPENPVSSAKETTQPPKSEQLQQTEADQSEKPETDDISPGGGPNRKLKLGRNSKRTRCKYTEESAQESKKHKRSPTEKPLQSSSKQSFLAEDESQLADNHSNRILAPQTCDPDLTVAMEMTSRERAMRNRPNIVIPETVPFGLGEFSQDEDSDDENKDVQDTTEDKSKDLTCCQPTVVNALLTPPSLGSTPLTSGGQRRQQRPRDTGAQPEEQNAADVKVPESDPKHTSPKRRKSSALSEPSSPVFGKNKDNAQLQDLLSKSTRSPSLFEDEEVEEISALSFNNEETSPSVLSGKIKILKRFPNSSPRSSAKKFVQTTLNLSKRHRLSFDPDETVDPCAVKDRDQTAEDKMLELAKKQSLESFHIEKAARDEEISFTEPRYTSTQVGGFKKPFQPPQTMQSTSVLARNLNGTIDPNLNLSEFNTQKPGEFEEENYSIETPQPQGKRPSQRSLTRSQNPGPRSLEYSEYMPEATAKSVVFGKKVNAKEKELKDEPRDSSWQEEAIDLPEGDVSADFHDSFDRVPQDQGPGYAYVEVVRKRNERQKLDAFVCRECELYYEGFDLNDEEKKERMKSCRHRARFARPDTPEHYWDVDFPDTQEIRERGYLNTTQAQPSRFRRKRGLRPLFLENQNHNENENKDENNRK